MSTMERTPAAPPLSRFPILRTGSAEEARHAVTEVYLPHELLAESSAQLEMALNAVHNKGFTLGYLTYGAESTLTMPATEDCYHVNLTTGGNTRADRTDGCRATTAAGTSGIVLLPDQANTVRWTRDAEQLILKISRTSLESHLSDLIGQRVENVIDFDFGMDLTTPAGASLLSSVEFLARELDRPGGLSEMPLAREQLEAFIMSQLLAAVPHQYRDDLGGPVERVRLGRLKPVVDFIEMNADEPLTPNELARAGNISVRTLHASFQRTFGMSPLAYVRQVRLDHVRAELISNRNPEVRVTEVAMRWGFFHLSRFAQQYKERFGESPSVTIRRHAG